MPEKWLVPTATPVGLPFYREIMRAAEGSGKTFVDKNGVTVSTNDTFIGDDGATHSIPATGIGSTAPSLYLWIGLGLATAIGFGVLLFTGSQFVAFIASLVICYALYDQSVLPGAIFGLILISGISFLYLSRQA
jgi:hypothetical protein